jgi:hypothetical protein
MVLDQPALIPQAMDMARGVMPQGLMGSPLVVEVDMDKLGTHPILLKALRRIPR